MPQGRGPRANAREVSDEQRPAEQPGPLARAEALGKRLFAVPKAELDAKLEEFDRAQKEAGRRKAKPA